MSDWSSQVKKYLCHLGKGVKASIAVDKIWDTLLSDKKQERAIEVADNYASVTENVRGMEFEGDTSDDTMKLNWNITAKATLNLAQSFPCSLGGNFGFSVDRSSNLKMYSAKVRTRTFSITSSDVNNVYERKLSTYILSKMNLTVGEDPCSTLDQHMAKVEFQSPEMKQIALHCKLFFDEVPITHYIKTVHLGAAIAVKETKESLKQTASAKIEFRDIASKFIDATISGNFEHTTTSRLYSFKSLGTISKDKKVQKDTENEAIIDAAIEPVHELIRNKTLRTILGEILDEHMYYSCETCIVDPVFVSGKIGDKKAYLMVRDDKLCATTKKEDASSFILNLPEPMDEKHFNMFCDSQGEKRVMVPYQMKEFGVDLLPYVGHLFIPGAGQIAKHILRKYILDGPPIKVLDRGDHKSSIFTLEMPFAGDSSSVGIHGWKKTSYFIKSYDDFLRSSYYVYLKQEGKVITVATTESASVATRFSIARKNRSPIDLKQEDQTVDRNAMGWDLGTRLTREGAMAGIMVAAPILAGGVGASAIKQSQHSNYSRDISPSPGALALNQSLTFKDIVGDDFFDEND